MNEFRHAGVVTRLRDRLLVLILVGVQVACGGGGGSIGSSTQGSAAISTLAYVVSDCQPAAGGVIVSQTLHVRQGDRDPLIVAQLSPTAPLVPKLPGLCQLFGMGRRGDDSVAAGVFQRLGVTPDGATVVFEVTDDATQLLSPGFLAAEQKGIFAVSVDGTGLRSLGAPSQAAAFAYSFPILDGPQHFAFSPDGRTIAFTDLGPGVDGGDAIQIFTLGLDTRRRTQVTHLPPSFLEQLPDQNFGAIPRGYPFFVDAETIAFSEWDPVPGDLITLKEFTVQAGGGVAEEVPGVTGSQLCGSNCTLNPLNQTYHITGANTGVALLLADDGPFGLWGEVFLFDGPNVLQLTNFHSSDTFEPTLSLDGQRVMVETSADPLGENPAHYCQLFSVDRLGGDLRQLTHFSAAGPATNLCGNAYPGHAVLNPKCTMFSYLSDAVTGSIVLDSTCDPFGENPHGGQLFVMAADGSGLRQLTKTMGYGPGSSVAELAGPWASPSQLGSNGSF